MPDNPINTLRISHEHLRDVVRHAQANAPHEACGLLVGINQRVLRIIPMANVAPDPEHAFSMDPTKLLHELQAMEANNETWLGIYHSHPTSSPRPSPTDIREARLNTPGLAQMIVSLQQRDPQVQLWRVEDDAHVYPIELLVGNERSTRPADLTRLQRNAILLASVLAVIILVSASVALLPAPPPLPALNP